jgi:uncharacterized protein (DUF488 family)
MLTIFTIGHSNHPIEVFLELLTRHEIALLADIRRFPGSRKHPHFNREALAATLAAQEIGYEWFEELGGRRKAAAGIVSANLGLRNESFRNYADYMETPEFQQGVEELLKAAAERPTALMCAEGLWWQCHRRLVSDYLLANGVAVEHIFPNGQTKPHAMTPEARNDAGRVIYPGPKTLFDDDAPP